VKQNAEHGAPAVAHEAHSLIPAELIRQKAIGRPLGRQIPKTPKLTQGGKCIRANATKANTHEPKTSTTQAGWAMIGRTPTRELPARVRSVLGLYQMGWRNRKEIANTVFNPVRKSPTFRQVTIVRGILNSKDPKIKQAKEGGIDFCGTGHLARSIRCPDCGQRITEVPCVRCRVSTVIRRVIPLQEPEQQPAVPAIATDAEAGSKEKVEVMRRRVFCGESATHPEDPIFEPKPAEIGLVLSDFGYMTRRVLRRHRYC